MTKFFETLMTGLDEAEAFLAGETAGFKVNLPAQIDVKARKRLKMTQARSRTRSASRWTRSSTGKVDAAHRSHPQEPS